MRILELHRHSMRKTGGGSQLSQAGVAYARALGATIGPFAQVVTSVVPRARETAIAMGFAVDYEVITLITEEAAYMEMGASLWWEQPQPFAALAELLATQGATWRYAQALATSWRDIISSIPDGSAALLIGHSGDLELGLVACFPHANPAAWGATFGHCEGARIVFDGEPAHFTAFELLRDAPS